MANIQPEIDNFQNAVYGEEVRGAMISLAQKLNTEVESGTDTIDDFAQGVTDAIDAANSAASDANEAASAADSSRTTIEANESARVSAESARALAEQGRASAETGRVSAEASRVTAEQGRTSAETSRVSAEGDRTNAETARAAAETVRTSAETSRASAEATRVSAEAERVGREAARVASEDLRIAQERDRVSAETERQRAFNNMSQAILPPATTTTLGGVVVGDGLSVDTDGKVSVNGAGDLETQTHAAETYATKTELSGKATSSHIHSASDITSGTIDSDRLPAVTTSQIDSIVGDTSITSGNVLTATGLTYLWGKLKNKFASLVNGVVSVAQGGTGKNTHTANAVLTGNGTSAVNNVATADGALYATSANGAPSFGTLPVAQGGTGATAAANARVNLGTPASSSIASVEQSTATASHASGAHFMLDGELRKATSAIASGESITSGNSTTDTLQAQIDTLRDSVSKVAIRSNVHLFEVDYDDTNGMVITVNTDDTTDWKNRFQLVVGPSSLILKRKVNGTWQTVWTK